MTTTFYFYSKLDLECFQEILPYVILSIKKSSAHYIIFIWHRKDIFVTQMNFLFAFFTQKPTEKLMN